MRELNLSGKASLSRNGLVTLVDDDIYDWASQFKWYAHDNKSGIIYARRCGTYLGKTYFVSLHACVTGQPVNRRLLIDHIDGNSLNNQRNNLRFCTNSQNVLNSRVSKKNKLGVKGVCYDSRAKHYRFTHTNNFYFKTLEEAIEFRDNYISKLYGEYAVTSNDPRSKK